MARKKSTVRSIDETLSMQHQLSREYERDRKIRLANYELLLHNNRTARDLLWDILNFTGFNSVTSAIDNSIFVSEGRRQVGADIISLLNEIDPRLYPTIILEKGTQNAARNDAPDDSD